MVWKTKVVLKVELPTGKLGLTVVKRPPTVGAVGTGSPVAGQVAPGDVILSLTLPGMGDVETKGKDGQAVMDTLVAFADREGRGLTVEKHGIYGVGVPPGPLGVQFHKGTCTVHAVTLRSPLRGVTKEGETLLAVNGKLVTPTTMLDEIEAADDGTSEREFVFRRSSKPLFAAGPAFRCVGVPPGPLGLQFHKGSGTVHAANPRWGVKEGETLVSVNGKPVNAATMLDEIKGADDGTSERMLIFRRASSSKFLLALAAGETENGPIVSKENAV